MMKNMTIKELGELVEKIIVIRDRYDMSRADKDDLADAANILYNLYKYKTGHE